LFEGAGVITEDSVRDALRNEDWDEEERTYADAHYRRFTYLLNLLDDELAKFGATAEKPVTVLDIGPHMLTGLVDRYFGNRVRIDTLGWESPRVYDTSHVHRHVQFDLNDAYDPASWPESSEHDIVLMAEVIEHLYTAPEQVLPCVRTFIRPGSTLVIGTPNAVSLPHRLRLLTGTHPYERIRLDRTHPGHFREYTANELAEVAQTTGFSVRCTTFHDFEPSRSRLVDVATRATPKLRRMMTVVLERDDR
jgi:hypothetical protein